MERTAASRMIPYSARIVRSMFPSATWGAPNGNICLTFDDGPHPRATPAVLDALDSYSVKATFFFTGRNVDRYPELVRETASRGHAIGNHAYDHALLFFRPRSHVLNQINRTASRIMEASGVLPQLFRPPYGYFRPTLLPSLHSTGHRLVMWNLDPRDWRKRPASDVASTILKGLRPGSIVLLHDNELTAGRIDDIVKRVLDSCNSGYEFSTLAS